VKGSDPRQSSRGANGFLGVEAIVELDRLFLDAYGSIEVLKAQSPATGQHLATPKLPTALSEGIAALAVPRLLGPGCAARNPTGRNDMEIQPDGRIVAVKGTGPSKWISITKTDLLADCLIWLDYSRRLDSAASSIDLWLFDDPVRLWATKNRLTFLQARRAFDREPKRLRISLRRLKAGYHPDS
jgi:hypothetical protein